MINSRKASNSILNLLIVFVIAVTIADLWLVSHLPIYSDEVGYLLIHSRYHLDGGNNVYLFPFCGNSYVMPVPFWMLPFRFLTEYIYNHQVALTHLRLIGVIFHALSLIILIILLWASFKKQYSLSILTLIVLLFFGLGIAPFITVFNRPDYWIWMSVVLWSLLSIILSQKSKISLRHQLIIFISIILSAAAIASMHLKSILFFPLAIMAIWYLGKKFFLRFIGVLSLIFIAISAFLYWNGRLSCPNYPKLNNFLGQALSPFDLFNNPSNFLWSMFSNIINFYKYWENILFQERYISDWLLGATQSWFSDLVNVMIWCIFIVVLCLIFISIIATIKHRKTNSLIIAFGISFCCFIVMASISIPKYFIESQLMIPFLGLIALLGFSSLSTNTRVSISKVIMPIFFIAWSLSQYFLFQSYIPYIKNWNIPGYAKGQYISYVYKDYATTKKTVLALAKKCNINLDERPTHLIVDGSTYPALKESYQPFEIIWTIMNWPGNSEEQLNFLKKTGSQGLVGACNYLPANLLKNALQDGPYCCLPAF